MISSQELAQLVAEWSRTGDFAVRAALADAMEELGHGEVAKLFRNDQVIRKVEDPGGYNAPPARMTVQIDLSDLPKKSAARCRYTKGVGRLMFRSITVRRDK